MGGDFSWIGVLPGQLLARSHSQCVMWIRFSRFENGVGWDYCIGRPICVATEELYRKRLAIDCGLPGTLWVACSLARTARPFRSQVDPQYAGDSIHRTVRRLE
jgi:hypothetical protein